jgi:hypothetical protein
MLVTLTNTSGGTLNALDSYAGATGGARSNPLPHPFGWIGSLANGGTKQLAMNPADLYYKSCPSAPFAAWESIQTMVKAGKISMAVADQSGLSPYGAFDELFFIEVG